MLRSNELAGVKWQRGGALRKVATQAAISVVRVADDSRFRCPRAEMLVVYTQPLKKQRD
jgi:hypothetical protein